MAQQPVPKQYLFVSNRDINVGSLTGRSILFEKGIPTHVPREMHAEVMEKGIIPVEAQVAEEVTAAASAPKILLAPEDPHEREDKISEAIRALVAQNDSRSFTAGGVPSDKAVTAALGWKVDQKEIRTIWTKLKPLLAKDD
jgi:hypothetical protein